MQQLCRIIVTGNQWSQFLDAHIPRTEPKTGQPLPGRSLTMADGKGEVLQKLYRYDSRVAPWAGTAHGVLQA